MVKVSIVIPAYNAAEHFEDCLGSIFSQTFKEFEVIWVDSASIDDSVQQISGRYPQVKLIVLTSNIGYRGGINVGARAARGEYLVICNQDTAMNRDWLAQMVASIEADPSVGIVAPMILMFGDRTVINEAGNTLHFTGLYGSRGLGCSVTEFGNPEVIATMSGCCFLIRRELWEKLGGFSEDFDQLDTGWHASFEDVDLAWRAQLIGYAVMFCPQAIMCHKYEAKGMPPERFCSYEWGRYLVILRNYELKTLVLLIPSLLIWEFGAWLYAIVKGQRWLIHKIRVMHWLITNITKLKQMRYRIQSMRIVSDRDIIERMNSEIQVIHLLPQNRITKFLQEVLDAIFGAYYRLLLLGLSLLD